MKPLYKKTANGSIQQWEIHVLKDTYTTRSGKHGGVLTPRITTCKGKNLGRANETTAYEQAQKEALAKWTKKKEREQYSEDINNLDTFSFFQPMLALDATKVPHRIDWKNKKYIAQPKLNGVRCIATCTQNGVILTSRKGKVYNLPHIEKIMHTTWLTIAREHRDFLFKVIYFDGELYMHGKQLGDITHAVAHADPTLEFHIFDMIINPGEGNNRHRIDDLNSYFYRYFTPNTLDTPLIQRVPNNNVKSMEDYQSMHDLYVSKGYEGAMLRDLGAEYQCGKKTPALFKLKAFQDSEFEVLNIEPDKTGAAVLTLTTGTGTTFRSRPLGTQEYKEDMLRNKNKIIGKMATVRYSMLLNSGAPEFNRVVAIRDYE